MRINYLIHHKAEMPGAILDWAKQKNIENLFTFLFNGDEFLPLENFDALIIMGGPMNIYEEDSYPFLKPEKAFIREAIQKGKKVLGICLGSQLIADILGEKVFSNNYSEIGWYPVYLTEAGASTSLLEGIDFHIPVLHWHGDTYNIPEKAVHLLQSEACISQAFLYNDNVLALQFHFETTIGSLEEMTEMDRAFLVKNKWIMSEKEMLEGAKYIEANNRILFLLLDRFFF